MNKSKVGYADNIQDETLNNNNFRKVVFTGKILQLVLMTLRPGEDIGKEIHDEHDQFFRIEEGTAKVIMNGEETILSDDEAAVVPAGVEHNVVNVGDGLLKFYTIYAPPEHPDGTVLERKV